MPKVSVVVPVYNTEQYLEKCIESVLKQTEKNFELILVNDGSTDSSGAICDKYSRIDERVRVIHKGNGGVSKARNTGIDNSRGEYITFVDSDDYLERDYLELMIAEAEKNKLDLVICGYKKILKDRVEVHSLKKNFEINEFEFVKGLMLQKGYGISLCKLYRAELLRTIRFREDLKVGEDTFFNLEVSKEIHKGRYIDKILYNYNVNSSSTVRNYNEKYLDNYLYSANLAKEYIFRNYEYEEIRECVNNYVFFTMILVIINYCCNPQKNNGNIFGECKDIKNVCNIKEYRDSIKYVKVKYLSRQRKIMSILLKCRLYFIAAIIGNIRQKQIKGNK